MVRRATRRRFAVSAAALLLLALPAGALAAPQGSRIVNGTEASPGEYPAQGYLTVDLGVPFVRHCGGTLVGTRQFLTAAQCAAGHTEAPEDFTVALGELNIQTPNSDVYGVTDVDVHNGYLAGTTHRNDVAMLTLDRPASAYLVMRVVDAGETSHWAPGVSATIVGWGDIEFEGSSSDLLLEAQVPIRSDEDCEAAYDTSFEQASMVCAGAADPDAGSSDSCDGDTGGPLMVPDVPGARALAGVASSGFECNREGYPGIYARVGGPRLNPWVKARTPEANFDLDYGPRVNESVTLFSTSHHPEDPGYWSDGELKWDLDDDGLFDDATGASIEHTYSREGQAVAGLEAAKAGGDRSVVYYAFNVGPDPNAPQPATGTPPSGTPPSANPVAQVRLATILAARRPRVRGRRFPIRVRFARTAPRGVAVIEVYRGRRRIGIARTRVRRGATKRVSVKLTPAGARLLRRAANGRLQVRLRVRVGRRVLRTRRLTIRR